MAGPDHAVRKRCIPTSHHTRAQRRERTQKSHSSELYWVCEIGVSIRSRLSLVVSSVGHGTTASRLTLPEGERVLRSESERETAATYHAVGKDRRRTVGEADPVVDHGLGHDLLLGRESVRDRDNRLHTAVPAYFGRPMAC